MVQRVANQASPPAVDDSRDLELLKKLAVARRTLIAQIGRRIIGHQEVIENLVAAILAGGHVMIVGVPGLAKTLLVQTVSEALDLTFSRVQFTPDLMPSDITGTELLEEDHATGRRVFKFVQGPIFGNVVLADEINRAPPKTQAALLQAMQEHSVTVAGQTYRLPEPFFVLATQNPIEQEATYPLPEAQLDRFMFELRVNYPSTDEEEQIVSATTGDTEATIQPVLTGAEVLELQHLVRRLPAPPTLVKFAVQIARSTRPGENGSLGRDPQVPQLRRRPAGVAVPGAGRQGARRDGRTLGAGPRRRAGDRHVGSAAPCGAELPGGSRGRHLGAPDGPGAEGVGRRRSAGWLSRWASPAGGARFSFRPPTRWCRCPPVLPSEGAARRSPAARRRSMGPESPWPSRRACGGLSSGRALARCPGEGDLSAVGLAGGSAPPVTRA